MSMTEQSSAGDERQINNWPSGGERAYSRVGLSLFVMSVIIIGLQILVTIALTLLQDSGYDYTSSSWLLWVATFLPIYGVGFPVYLAMLRRLPAEPAQPTRLGGKNFWLLFLMCVPIMLTGNIIGTLLSNLLSGGSAENSVVTLASDTSLLKILVMVVLAPLLEELIFRKQIIDRCAKYGEKTAMLFSALTFALFHMNLFQFFYALGLGWMFAYVYTRTRRFRYPVIMHMIINFIGAVLAPWVLSQTDTDAIRQVASGVTDQATMAKALPGLALFGGYVILLWGLAIAGLVLLIIRAKKFVFLPASEELPEGQRFQTVYCNVGMILFAALCIGLCVFNLMT